MNTNSKKIGGIGATIAAALLLSAGSAYAGGQTHVMPANYGKAFPAYEIRVVSLPTSTAPLTVRLVSTETGQLVTNADVTMQHTVWLGIKAAPQVQHVQLALTPDGKGNYVCSRGPLPAGDKIVLRAHVPGEPTANWLTLASNI